MSSLRHASSLFVLCSLLAGCSDAGTEDAGSDESEAGTAEVTSSGDHVETGDGDGDSSDGGDGDSAGDGDEDTSGDGDGDGLVAAELYPLAVGNSWTYSLTMVGDGSPTCSLGSHSAEVLSTMELDGQEAARVRTLCDASELTLGIDGDAVDWHEASQDPSWNVFLANPVMEGAEWTTHFDLAFRWTAETGPVSTPAGEFEGCWRREVVGTQTYTTFCPGVGPVMTYAPESFYQAVIESYTVL